MELKFDFIQVTLDPDNYKYIKEIYRLHKEQANKVFNLASGINTDEDIMDMVKNDVENNIVFLGIDKATGNYAGVITFDNTYVYNDEIVTTGVHLIVSKKYWGKDSRQLVFDFYKYTKENLLPIRRMEAFVPSHNFGIIKLLKDVGFKIEGTLKNRVVYKNKEGIPTYYNELVYSNMNLGE